MSDEPTELLTSPIERRSVNRFFVIGGPLGLAIAIIVSLWISHLRVTHTVSVQMEPQWQPGESLALRVQVTPETPTVPDEVSVKAEVEQGGQRHALSGLVEVAPGLSQGTVTVPSLTPGPATLHLRIEAPPLDPRDERIEIDVTEGRTPVAAEHMVSSSLSQYGDDSDLQPDKHKIDIRPRGRVLAGFDNELWLRVTDDKGAPWSGHASIALVDGQLGDHRGSAETPKVLWAGQTDAAGLASIHGVLGSEILRLRVELRAQPDAAEPLASRMIRLLSFAGAVNLRIDPLVTTESGQLEVLAAGLRAKRPVFVDVHGPDGAWIETFNPPIHGREPAKPWTPPASMSGLLQFEAYHYTNEPGESTAVARLWVLPSTGDLKPLIERQRDKLSVSRPDRTWDEARERGYLDALGRASLPTSAESSARTWLTSTLPIEVHGPPTLLRTRERDMGAMLDYKKAWAQGMRIFLLGGGGLFLVAMTILMIRSHRRDAEATLRELQQTTAGEEREAMEAMVHQSRRAALLHGLLMVVMMAGGVASAVLLLESFVWDF
ncbi:MAG: hypothetical protein AAF799_14050 [Myxococcota bacterium]